jgi:hypothetical protein
MTVEVIKRAGLYAGDKTKHQHSRKQDFPKTKRDPGSNEENYPDPNYTLEGSEWSSSS